MILFTIMSAVLMFPIAVPSHECMVRISDVGLNKTALFYPDVNLLRLYHDFKHIV